MIKENNTIQETKKPSTLSNKISSVYKFFKLLNRTNKYYHKNRFFRQFNIDYVKKRHYALMQAIDFVRVIPYDEKYLKKLRENAKNTNAIEHVWEIEKRQLEVPDVKDETKFIRTTARNKVKVKIEMENCTKPFSRKK